MKVLSQNLFTSLIFCGVAGVDLLLWPNIQARSFFDFRERSLLLINLVYL